jgi:hypothetical protein
MSKRLSLAILFLLGINLMSTYAQQTCSQKRVADILATLNKKEQLVVEVHGVKKEKYREVRSEPVTASDVKQYSGTYRVPDLDYSLNIKIGSNGEITGSGSEAQKRHFVLKDAGIDGALLTATKVYDDGATEKFEGVFIKRTELNSPTDKGDTSYGIAGIVPAKNNEDLSKLDKLYYQRQ